MMPTFDLDAYRWVAQLIWPGDGEKTSNLPSPEKPEAKVLLDVLRRNKVPLLSLNSSWAEGFLAKPEVEEAVREERALWQRLRGEYALAHEILDEAGIRGVFIKSVGLPPSFPYKSDNLDLLVPREQGQRARDLLRRSGYVELTNLDEHGVKLLLRKFHVGREVCTIHLHMHVGWWVSFMDEEHVISRARPSLDDAIIWVPSPEDGALVNMAHSLYENKAISLSDLQKIEHCWLQGSLNWDYMRGVAMRKGWLDGLYFCVLLYDDLERRLHGRSLVQSEVREEALSELTRWQQSYLESLYSYPLSFPFPLSFAFSKRLFYRKIYRDRTTSTFRKIADAAGHTARGIHLKLGIRSQSPMLVALSGIDGSGKTTQAEALQRAFQSCAIRARCVWSRIASSPFTDLFIRGGKRILRHRTNAKGAYTSHEVLSARRAMLCSPLIRWAWQWMVVLDLLVRYWLQVGWPLLRGEVVIADRYVDDALADLAVHLGWQYPERTVAGRVLRLLSPRPRLTYVFDLPAEVAAQRMAGERESVKYLKQSRAVYQRLAQRGQIEQVDARRPLEDIADSIVHRTLTCYFDRYWTLVNALFAANPVRASRGGRE